MIKTVCKITSLMILVITTFIILSGCSIIDNRISDFNNKTSQWEINKYDATQIIYNNKFYQITENEIGEDETGKLIGRIGKIAILNENYKLMKQETLNVSNIFDIDIDSKDEYKYIVPFQNIYQMQNDKSSDTVIADINGKYCKAVAIDKKDKSNIAIEFKDVYVKLRNGFKLNTENYNQLLSGDKVYIITKEIVDIEDLDLLLDTINKTEVIDIKTGRKIDKEESKKIEIIPDELSTQERKYIEFGDVYSIKNKDVEKFITIKINNEYRLAKIID